jgi:hypothetical protein
MDAQRVFELSEYLRNCAKRIMVHSLRGYTTETRQLLDTAPMRGTPMRAMPGMGTMPESQL